MSLSPIPPDHQPVDRQGRWTAAWQSWMESINTWLGPVGNFGATANRPSDTSRHPLYIGQGYFDTTLGYPVYVKARNPTVWVDGGGTVR